MVDASRANLRRIDQEQNNQYKRTLAFIFFLIISLTMITVTFLNPVFMKKQIRTNNNQALVVKQINVHFDTLANLIGDSADDNSNLLTDNQTQPIADHIIDYTLGLHWVRLSDTELANQILNDIDKNIDQSSTTDAQHIRRKLKLQGNNANYFISQAFSLNVVVLGANIASLLIIVNIIIIIVTIIALISLIKDMKMRSNNRSLIHDITAAGMWTGFWLILICGLLSVIPVFVNIESLNLGTLGYLIEISSTILLDFVIAGVVLYVICAIPWQITATK